MPNLWAGWACGNPDRMRTTARDLRLLSCFRLLGTRTANESMAKIGKKNGRELSLGVPLIIIFFSTIVVVHGPEMNGKVIIKKST